jgi:hypothetical protein
LSCAVYAAWIASIAAGSSVWARPRRRGSATSAVLSEVDPDPSLATFAALPEVMAGFYFM